MDMISGIVDFLRWLTDLVTGGFRAVHAVAPDFGAGTQVEVAVLTWIGGSVVTFGALGLMAFGWYEVFRAFRTRLRRMLERAARGLDLDKSQRLADEYVKIDRAALGLQVRSGVASIPQRGAVPASVVRRARGSRLAVAFFGMSRSARGSGALVRVVFASVWGWLGLAATWWAMGRPGAAVVLSSVEAGAADAWRMTSTELSVLGVTIAVATFALSRLRSVRASGHHAWRKAEVGRASDELARREVAIDTTLAGLERSLDEVHRSWLIEIHDRPDMHVVQIAEKESDLRRLLGLPAMPLDRSVLRAVWRPQGVLPGCEPQVKEAADALADLRTYLDSVDERTETALRRYAPWAVVRVASRSTLESSVTKIVSFVGGPARDALRLRDAEWYSRLVADDEREQIDAWELARAEWREQAEDAQRDLREWAHEAQVQAQIGIAELRDTSDRIFAYLHPTGPLRRARDRLLPS